ncbi:MAG: pirin family protein [Woeseiaceae bacterium]
MDIKIRDVTLVPEGDGVDVKRLFPLNGFMNYDPFVLWDHFDIGPDRGFPDHPHRGFEAITYMFKGGMNHKDNLGNESFVTAGGAQRFTAGKGLVHSEMPAEDDNSNGIQLWINLPKKLKQIEPSYQQVNEDEFPVLEVGGAQVKILVGESSPLKLNTDVIYQHIKLNKSAKYTVDIKASMRGIIYLIEGELVIGQFNLKTDQALFVENRLTLELLANENSEFMLCFGVPHNEPIRQYGPFVD